MAYCQRTVELVGKEGCRLTEHGRNGMVRGGRLRQDAIGPAHERRKAGSQALRLDHGFRRRQAVLPPPFEQAKEGVPFGRRLGLQGGHDKAVQRAAGKVAGDILDVVARLIGSAPGLFNASE